MRDDARLIPAPRTEAGKRLLFEYRHWFVEMGWEAQGWDPAASAANLAAGILAIEAEAAAPQPRDADAPRTEQIAGALRAAENAWAKFVHDNPAKVPRGARWPEREGWIAAWLVDNDDLFRAAKPEIEKP